MAIQLKNSGNTVVYEFPSSCNFESEAWSKRLGQASRVHQHGAVIIADEKVAARVVSVRGIFGLNQINSTYGATVSANLKEMKQQCYTQDLRLYPGSQYADEYYNVECLSFDGYWRRITPIIEVGIDFLVADPRRYYKDETTDPKTVNESPEASTVTNDGDLDVSPVIAFTAGSGANFSKLSIKNNTDSEKYFDYEPAANLTEDDVVEIDCKNTTVRLDTGAGFADDISHFEGSFFELLAGNNSIIVTIVGTVGTNVCNFVFRKAWL